MCNDIFMQVNYLHRGIIEGAYSGSGCQMVEDWLRSLAFPSFLGRKY
jgi:hypothetical protein